MKRALLAASGVLWLSSFILFLRYAHAHIAAGVLDFAQRHGVDLAQPTLWAIRDLAHWRGLGACTALFSVLALAGRACFVKSLFVVLPLAIAAVLLFFLTMPLHKWGIVV